MKSELRMTPRIEIACKWFSTEYCSRSSNRACKLQCKNSLVERASLFDCNCVRNYVIRLH